MPVKLLETSAEDRKQIERFAEAAVLKGSVDRAIMLCYVLAVAHVVYGFASYAFIRKFQPELTLVENILPRLLLNVGPFILLGEVLKRSRFGDAMKIKLYIWFYSVLFCIAAMIKVWPIALQGNQEIFLYVGGVNTAYLCSTWALAAFPRRFLKHSFFSVMTLIVLPVIGVNFYLGDLQIFQTVFSDIMFATATGLGLGYLSSNVHWELETIRATQRVESSKYIEEPVQKSIFEGAPKLDNARECTAYVFVIDIRDSTQLTRKYKDKWASFTTQWLSEAIEIIRKHSGTFVKSTGDGLIGAFGLFDDENVLNDIADLDGQNKQADEVRWVNLTIDAFGCINELMNRFKAMTSEHFPQEAIKMGCGLDRGNVHRGVRGGTRRREFDIWGDKVNTAAKLEGFSKSIQSHFPDDCSLLVVSPFASDFLENVEGFQKVPIDDETRGGLHGMRWVLVRPYARILKSTKAVA